MTMENCRKCKKLFPRLLSPICEDCIKEEEELFQSVRKHLQENPNSTIAKTAEVTGVSAKKIMGYLRDGRIELSETNSDLHCRVCGTPIKSGTYCEPCHIKVQGDLQSAIARQRNEEVPEPPKVDTKPKDLVAKRTAMHTSERRNRDR